VRSYRTVPSLPDHIRRSTFLWHFPWGHPRWTLSSTLPYGARTFLECKIHSRSSFLLTTSLYRN